MGGGSLAPSTGETPAPSTPRKDHHVRISILYLGTYYNAVTTTDYSVTITVLLLQCYYYSGETNNQTNKQTHHTSYRNILYESSKYDIPQHGLMISTEPRAMFVCRFVKCIVHSYSIRPCLVKLSIRQLTRANEPIVTG